MAKKDPRNPKGFKVFRDRHGGDRCYHRKTSETVDLKMYPLYSHGFYAECERIASASQVITPKAGTLGMLFEQYRASPNFLEQLEPRTRADYLKVMDYLKPISDVPLIKFDRPLVVRIRDKAAEKKKRRFGNYVRAVLSLVFAWGAERGYVRDNPATGIRDIRKKKGTPDANRPWSDEERHAVLIGLPAHMRPAMALMMFTGLGPKDAVRLPRSFYKAGEIATNRSKTGVPVFWPAPQELVAILENAPTHNAVTLVANRGGRPWTESGYRASWRKVRMGLEEQGAIGPGLTLYGLRHTVAVILREMGLDERTIADALGQTEIKSARHYAKGADLKPKMRGVVKQFDVELNKRRTQGVKPDENK
jgi:integrase